MIGSILKELRKSKGLTVAKAAELFGVASRTYTSYELEEREPNLTMLNKIADYYGVTTDYLLGREPAPDPLSLVTAKVDDDKFVELYSSLPEYAKSIFIDTMEKLAQAKKDQTQKKHRAYMETTLGAIEEQNELASEEEGSA
jgi:transcriptional regulator with XRE-family HTH domain